MGRDIVVEQHISKYIDILFAEDEKVTGLILGQSTLTRDFVTHLARTPPPSNSAECEHTEQEKTSVGRIERNKSKEKKLARVNLPHDDIEETWILQHGKKVTRMLPGGWEILGIFMCSSDVSLSTSSIAKLQSVLLNMYKLLEKHPRIYNGVDLSDRLLLHICPKTNKIMCSRIDLQNATRNPTSVDWKYRSNRDNSHWIKIETRMALNQTVPLRMGHDRTPLIKQLRSGFESYCENVDKALVSYNTRMRNAKEKLWTPSSVRGHHGDDSGEVRFLADFFMKPTISGSVNRIDHTDCDVLMHLKGVLQGRTYVNSNATVFDATKAIKQDVLRSLLARCEIHCEDLLLIDEERHDPWVVHEPPRRVFAPLPGNLLTISDYLFPGERPDECLYALEELMDLELSEDQIEIQHERSAETADLKSPDGEMTDAHKEVHLTELLHPKTNYNKMIAIILGVAVAVVSVGISLLYLRN